MSNHENRNYIYSVYLSYSCFQHTQRSYSIFKMIRFTSQKRVTGISWWFSTTDNVYSNLITDSEHSYNCVVQQRNLILVEKIFHTNNTIIQHNIIYDLRVALLLVVTVASLSVRGKIISYFL